ncbi:D-alanine--D-alanine ligase [Thermosulfurimonas marina]|uniref:D-alanine--D-alanine ligase n=1 Tax=Thermosulfurimonas marina TaxID=2047767 RepID=A0A6H1WTR9_9BACT|nr:D-alanine--D-alanine ligase [Thermosulfurimonas marina]QJA06544.1 D-alanine--D-alanine ligase [Thermosulfurimonas marina]
MLYRVALLAGGDSPEREVALRGGAAVERALKARGHEVVRFDPPRDLPRLAERAAEFDAAFLVLHGPGGEDGTIQGFLDSLGLPYQGAGVLGSALAIHKGLSRLLYREAGLSVPPGGLFSRKERERIPSFCEELGYPVVVKPATQGSSLGLSVVKSPEDLSSALERALALDREVVVEKFLRGRELTVAVLGEEALPVVEIIPQGAEYFDYHTKYTPGAAREICPAEIPEEVARRAQEAALRAHQALRLRHYSRTDLLLVEGEIYLLETNTIPGMTETSLLPLAARAAGLSFEDLVERLLEMALEG